MRGPPINRSSEGGESQELSSSSHSITNQTTNHSKPRRFRIPINTRLGKVRVNRVRRARSRTRRRSRPPSRRISIPKSDRASYTPLEPCPKVVGIGVGGSGAVRMREGWGVLGHIHGDGDGEGRGATRDTLSVTFCGLLCVVEAALRDKLN